MKILMIVPSVSRKWGGTTTSVMNFYNGLSCYLEIKCTVVTTVTEDEKNEISKEILENDDFILFPTKSSGWRYSKELKNYLHNNMKNYDLVWIHALWTGTTFYAYKYANKFNMPYIVSPHGMIEPDALNRKGLKKKLYWSLIEQRVFDGAAAIHCITEAESNYATQLTQTKNFIIPNGTEKELFLEKQYDQLESICFIGRFHEIKALDLLLKAVSKVDDVKLLVAGSGEKEYEKYIYGLAKVLQIEDRVEFKGFANKEEKRDILMKSAFIVVPSFSEVLSLVALESIMCSTPVLLTRQCNFNEIKEFNAGIVMEDNDPETIRKYILKMLNSDIEKMSKNAHALAMEKFSIDSVSAKILEEFEVIINDNRMNIDKVKG